MPASRRLRNRPRGGPLVQRLKDRFGDRATDSVFERSFYRRDVAPLPLLVDRVLQTEPDLVVRPVDAEEVSFVLREAAREGVPVVPRASATSALFGCVPVRGGVVMDLSGMRGVVGIDAEAMTVVVRAGTVWLELERVLNLQGLAVKSMPSSAPASSVGGWVCGMGFGIGSTKYGRVSSQVRSLEVVLADGSIRRLRRDSRPPLGWFEASEGTLGVVTEVELEVRPLRPMRHFLVECADLTAVQRILAGLLSGEVVPYSLHFDDRWTCAAMKALGYAPEEACGLHLVRADYEGEDAQLDLAEDTVRRTLAATPGARALSAPAAEHEWEERFRLLRIKRGGPSMVGSEVLLPLAELTDYLNDVERIAAGLGVRLMSYGHAAGEGKVVVMTMFYTDETKSTRYLLALGTLKRLHDAAAARGGLPYGLGLWNTPHLRRRLAEPSLEEGRRRKHELDPGGVMNPGKGVARLAVMNPVAFRAGMGALAGVNRVTRRGGRA